jgi:hypothetical protein
MNLDHTFNSSVDLSSSPLPARQSIRHLFVHRLDHLWQSLIKLLTSSSELQIRPVQDIIGQTWWCVYDPVSDRSVCFLSQAEAYACLNDDKMVL